MSAQCRPRGPGEQGTAEADTPPPLEFCPPSATRLSLLGPGGQGGASLRRPAGSQAGPVASAKGLRAHLGPRRGRAAFPLSPQMQILGALPFRERLPLPPSPVINYPTETWHGNPIPPVGNEGMKGQSWLRKDRPPLPCPGLPSRPCPSAPSHLVQCRWRRMAGHGAPAGARAATSL